MYKYLLVSFILTLGITSSVSAATETVRFYSDLGTNGVTTDGRMFEDRYADWNATVDSVSARITSMSDGGQDLSNYLGSGYGADYYACDRLHFGFDTATLPDEAEIVSATFYMRSGHIDESSGLERRMYLVSSNPSANNTLVNTDYSKVGDTSLGVSDGTWSILEYHNIALNDDGISWINKTGVTNFALRGWYDFNHIAPTNSDELIVYVYLADEAGTSSDPYLEVTYQVEDEKDSLEYLAELIGAIEEYGLGHKIEKSYMVHLRKVERLLENEKYTPAKKQVRAFMRDLRHDVKTGKIDEAVYNDLRARGEALLGSIPSRK